MDRNKVENRMVEVQTKNLWATDVIVCEIPAGAAIWNVIKDAVALKDHAQAPVWFEFNDQLIKVDLKDTVEDVERKYNQ